jgi:hypothetical protein
MHLCADFDGYIAILVAVDVISLILLLLGKNFVLYPLSLKLERH